ncbi:hypothetical protein Hanom_Chr08g00725771 [Helianthus anomalus]
MGALVVFAVMRLTSSCGGEVKMWIWWPRVAKSVYRVYAWRSIPPGVAPSGHFLEKTAILRTTGGGMLEEKLRRFHENSAERRSPEKEEGVVVEKGLHMEAGGVWRRRRAGMVKRMMHKRVVSKLDWIGKMGLLVLLVVGAMTVVVGCGGDVFLRKVGLVFVVVNMVLVGI